MLHHTSLIATIVAGIGLAFIFGVLANRLHLSPLVGYLLAGVLIGPFTPGFVADQALAPQLAEIGVILLMFGIGLHFSLKDLLAVRTIAVPGALGQITLVTLLGFGLAHLLGWSWGAGVIFGLALSVASTVVVLRVLQERRLIETERGHIAVGWLIVEDLAMILVLVLIPALAGLMGGQPVDHTEGSALVRVVEAAHDLGCSRPHSSPGWCLHRPDVDRRPAPDPVGSALRRPYRVTRAVPACRARHGAGRGVRLGRTLRRVVCARSLLCRYDPGGVPPETTGSPGDPSPERCLRSPVLCIGWDAVRPDDPGDPTRAGAGDLRYHRGRQRPCGIRDRTGLPLFSPDSAYARCKPVADW